MLNYAKAATTESLNYEKKFFIKKWNVRRDTFQGSSQEPLRARARTVPKTWMKS